MSRSGYYDDIDRWDLIRWRGAVRSAIRGARGQRLLREMLAALDAMERKELIAEELEKDGEVCALGAVGRARGIDMKELDPEDYEAVAEKFGVAHALAQEIAYINDEEGRGCETPSERWARVRRWAASQLQPEAEKIGKEGV